MELLFIGVACTEEAIKESNKKYYNNVSQVNPQQYFDMRLTSGLSQLSNVTAVTIPPVAAYPRSKCLIYNRKQDKVSKTLKINYIKLLNILGLKTLIIMIYTFFYTLLFCFKNRNKEVVIFLGSILFYTAIPAMLAAKIFKRKVYMSVPDVPKYIGDYSKSKTTLRSFLDKNALFLNRLYENKFEGYILLTEQMNELINLNKKPYIVIEGMANTEEIIKNNNVIEKSENFIMYAGTLHEKFGIKKLVQAFKFCKTEDYELWIFGVGDYLEELQKEILINPKIKYKGSVSRFEILNFERKATLLVNPRPSSEKFTKYSFPSKTIEYMGSGTPLLTTRLPGIPEEYFEYVYSFKSEDILSMAADIDHILSMPLSDLEEFGQKAQEFIITHKSHIAQTKKIIDFIK